MDCIQKGDFEKMTSLVKEANDYVLQNKFRSLTLKGEIIAYIKILQFLNYEVPKNVIDFLNSID